MNSPTPAVEKTSAKSLLRARGATRVGFIAKTPTQQTDRPVRVVKNTQPVQNKPKDKKPTQSRSLKALGIPSADHALLCVPSAYTDCRRMVSDLREATIGVRELFYLSRTGVVEAVDKQGTIIKPGAYGSIWNAPYQGFWSKIAQLKIQVKDVRGNYAWLSYFGAWRLKGSDPYESVLVSGELKQFGDRLFITSPVEPPADVAGKIWARYVCPGAPSEATVRTLVLAAKQNPKCYEAAAHHLVTESLMSEGALLKTAHDACGESYHTLIDFFEQLHNPSSVSSGVAAACAARAMAVAGVCNAAQTANIRRPHPQAALNIAQSTIDTLIASQPETLTNDQLKVIQQLLVALRSPTPLNGLLSGDTGTGKTLPFVILGVAAQMSGAKVAVISPTEILANQVATNIQRRFPQAKVERVFAGKKIQDDSAILVGTSGLNGVAKKQGYLPNFLVIDEQHKLSTGDRSSMLGPWTHQLEASATPIPRSLANTLFSGMQVLTLTQAPVKRDVESFVFDENNRSQISAWLRDVVKAHNRVAVIYPKVALSEQSEQTSSAADMQAVNSVNDAALALEKVFPDGVGKLHGKMTSEQVEATLAEYRSGQKRVVVASTIMETGIDIPDIRLLIVKGADNFGVAQLHQLRGRLARNGGAAKFVMMVQSIEGLAPETKERLDTIAATNDGYSLAEADMSSRGFGDLSGSDQSGNISCAFSLLRLGLADFWTR